MLTNYYREHALIYIGFVNFNVRFSFTKPFKKERNAMLDILKIFYN